jgi:hypothetical protein
MYIALPRKSLVPPPSTVRHHLERAPNSRASRSMLVAVGSDITCTSVDFCLALFIWKG